MAKIDSYGGSRADRRARKKARREARKEVNMSNNADSLLKTPRIKTRIKIPKRFS